uniref:Uncharacterized protein n=1 Tax=Oryza punctata TaxID=4537 RepID=A0A0E0LX58_ORYPU
MTLQRTGAGMALSMVAVAMAAAVEGRRLATVRDRSSDRPAWLVPVRVGGRAGGGGDAGVLPWRDAGRRCAAQCPGPHRAEAAGKTSARPHEDGNGRSGVPQALASGTQPAKSTDKTNTEKIHAISEGGDAQVPASESEYMVIVKTSEPFEVEQFNPSLADEDKGDVRGGGRLKGFPTETEATGSRFSNHVKNNGSWFHEDSNHLEHISQSKGDVHGPLQLAPTRKENTLIASGHVVERTVSAVLDIIKPEDKVATEDKGKDRNRDVVYDKADDINSLASIEEILKLHFKAEMIEKRCQNCSNAAQKASPISDKHGEQMVACTNVNRTVDGDQQALCCLCDTKSRAADQWLFGSSLWFCASDAEIREISLEEVLKCEALPSFLREDGRLRCLESTSC